MWFLIMVLLNMNGVTGLDQIIVLQTHATSQECESERNRIGYEMAEAYPYERDFVIACKLNPRYES